MNLRVITVRTAGGILINFHLILRFPLHDERRRPVPLTLYSFTSEDC